MPAVISGGSKRSSPKSSTQNVPIYKMPPIDQFTNSGKLYIDYENLEDHPQSKGHTPVVKASNQQFE